MSCKSLLECPCQIWDVWWGHALLLEKKHFGALFIIIWKQKCFIQTNRVLNVNTRQEDVNKRCLCLLGRHLCSFICDGLGFRVYDGHFFCSYLSFLGCKRVWYSHHFCLYHRRLGREEREKWWGRTVNILHLRQLVKTKKHVRISALSTVRVNGFVNGFSISIYHKYILKSTFTKWNQRFKWFFFCHVHTIIQNSGCRSTNTPSCKSSQTRASQQHETLSNAMQEQLLQQQHHGRNISGDDMQLNVRHSPNMQKTFSNQTNNTRMRGNQKVNNMQRWHSDERMAFPKWLAMMIFTIPLP